MNNLSPTGKWTILIVVIVVAILIIAFYGGNNGTNNPAAPGANGNTNATLSDNGSMPASGTMAMENGSGTMPGMDMQSSSASHAGGANGTVAPSAPKATITLITPVPGDTWIATMQNPVQWSKAAGVTGQIDLLSATTSQLVGVILNEIGPAQTSYTWNTRDLLQSRTSPSKLTVTPGRYIIRISFDGNNLPAITSQPFTIVADTSTVQ
ncbi:MAG TPA: hypothetical protein VHZ04_00530 [Candidatus Paceibacterota bacterium]|jgi:hypothetical protein|nr:hypothetical protein [Candidatus Paceibacterota bacterium]